MTASTRVRVFILAPCLVIAAAMQSAAQPSPPGPVDPLGLRSWSSRRVMESSIAIEVEARGTAVPTPAEQKDRYVAIEDVAPGDAPGEWVATTPHAAHWFDGEWRQMEITDLGRRYRRVRPVRFESRGRVALMAEEGDIDRLIEFDRGGREVQRIELRKSTSPVYGDLDGDGVGEIIVAVKKDVQIRHRSGRVVRTIPFDAFVSDLDLVATRSTGTLGLLVYQALSPSRGTRLRLVNGTGELLHEWAERDASRYSVAEWGDGAVFVSHLYRSLRLRDLSGRLVATRDSGYDLRTHYARAVRLGSGHEVFLLYNRHFGTSALVVYDGQGKRVHVEHPGGFTSTLWTVPGEPDAFYAAVGPDIVRYRLRP